MTRKENMSVIGITFKIFFIITIVAKSYGRHIVDKREACSTLPTYDIVCHGTCPRFDTSDWEKNKLDASCTHPKTYHCAYNKDGDPTEGCAEPIMCNKGKEPILYKEGNEYNLECQYCRDEHYLNSMERESDSFSECYEKRIYCNPKLGEKECLAIEGHERHYTQTKCTCNWHDYYKPDSNNSCSSDIRCVRHPCSDDQEMLSGFECHPKCDEGMERINDSIACVSRPKTSNFTETFTSTKQVETSTYSASSTLSTTNSSDKLEEKKEGKLVFIVIGVLVVAVVAVLVVIVLIVWCKRKKGHSNSPGESNQNGESQFIPFCSGIHCCNCTVIPFCSEIHCCNCSHTGHSNSPGESNQNGDSQYTQMRPTATSSSGPNRENSSEQEPLLPNNENTRVSNNEQEPLLPNNENTRVSNNDNSDGAGTNQSEQNETDNEEHTDNSEEAGTNQSVQNEIDNEDPTDRNDETGTNVSRQGNEIDNFATPDRNDETGTNVSRQRNEIDNVATPDNSEEAGTNQSMQNETDNEDHTELQSLLADNGSGNGSDGRQDKRQRKKLQEKLTGTGLEYRDICCKALNANIRALKDNMDLKLQDKLAEKGLFERCDLKDIKEIQLPSRKNGLIFDLMVDVYALRDENNYHLFKQCLDEIGQDFLVDKLEKSEDEIIEELKAKKASASDDSESDTEPETPDGTSL